jgi:hypothetical protein
VYFFLVHCAGAQRVSSLALFQKETAALTIDPPAPNNTDTRCLDFSAFVVETFKQALEDGPQPTPERAANLDALYIAAGAMALCPDLEGFRQGLTYAPAIMLLEMSELVHVAFKPDEVRILHRWAAEEIGYPSAAQI